MNTSTRTVVANKYYKLLLNCVFIDNLYCITNNNNKKSVYYIHFFIVNRSNLEWIYVFLSLRFCGVNEIKRAKITILFILFLPYYKNI